VNESQSQNECIGMNSSSLYTQENRRGIEEYIGENNSKRGVKEDCQVRMRNISKKSNELSLGEIYNSAYQTVLSFLCQCKYILTRPIYIGIFVLHNSYV
jgi:hypothetical protein